MAAVRCSSVSSSGHRCRRRTTDPRGICPARHGTGGGGPVRVLSASSDARHVGRAVTDALGSAFPRISFLVSHTGRLETTVEWAEGPQERDVLAGLVALFGAGFAIGADGRTIRDVRRRSAQPVLILVRHGEGPWRADFDDALARGGLVGAAA